MSIALTIDPQKYRHINDPEVALSQLREDIGSKGDCYIGPAAPGGVFAGKFVAGISDIRVVTTNTKGGAINFMPMGVGATAEEAVFDFLDNLLDPRSASSKLGHPPVEASDDVKLEIGSIGSPHTRAEVTAPNRIRSSAADHKM